MSDIALRFHKDVLVLSAPVENALARLGVDVEHDLAFTLLFEGDTIEEAYRLESLGGTQVLVAPTAQMTPARLAQVGMENQGPELARAALEALGTFKPQHVLVELGPCGLPLDPDSKASLVEHRDQYARAARFFDGLEFDGFFLNGFEDCTALKCALMGLAKVSDAPVFTSVTVDADGRLTGVRAAAADEMLEDAVRAAADLGAAVVGFETGASADDAVKLCARACATGSVALPVLVQLRVEPDGPYASPDALADAALALCGAGAQFLRAAGAARSADSGVLVATTLGLDVARQLVEAEEE